MINLDFFLSQKHHSSPIIFFGIRIHICKKHTAFFLAFFSVCTLPLFSSFFLPSLLLPLLGFCAVAVFSFACTNIIRLCPGLSSGPTSISPLLYIILPYVIASPPRYTTTCKISPFLFLLSNYSHTFTGSNTRLQSGLLFSFTLIIFPFCSLFPTYTLICTCVSTSAVPVWFLLINFGT